VFEGLAKRAGLPVLPLATARAIDRANVSRALKELLGKEPEQLSAWAATEWSALYGQPLAPVEPW
jgi:hypothetical protein